MGLAPGAFVFSFGAASEKSELAQSEFNAALNQLVLEGLTQEEIDQAKKIIPKTITLNYLLFVSFCVLLIRLALAKSHPY